MDSFKKRKSMAIQDALDALNAPLKDDQHIMLLAKAMEQVDQSAQDLGKRLFDWYSFYSPEVTFKFSDHFQFASLITNHTKEELKKKHNISMDSGSALSKEQVQSILDLARHIETSKQLKEHYELQIKKTMQKATPNILALTTPIIGSKLLVKAGSLQRLAQLPGSVIQTLGAEDALFKHLHQNKKPPKYGILYEHPWVQKAPAKSRGKVARSLAAKLALAARVDAFGKDTSFGDKTARELQSKWQKQGWLA